MSYNCIMKKYNIKRSNRRSRSRGGAETETKASLSKELSRLEACNGNPYMIFDIQQMYMTSSDMNKKYRLMALKYHPDKNKSNPDLASDITKIWNNARDVIKGDLENPSSNHNGNQGHPQQQENYARERQQQEAQARQQQQARERQQQQEAYARQQQQARERQQQEAQARQQQQARERQQQEAQARAEAEVRERERVRVEKEREKEKERIEALRIKAQKEREKEREKERIEALRIKAQKEREREREREREKKKEHIQSKLEKQRREQQLSNERREKNEAENSVKKKNDMDRIHSLLRTTMKEKMKSNLKVVSPAYLPMEISPELSSRKNSFTKRSYSPMDISPEFPSRKNSFSRRSYSPMDISPQYAISKNKTLRRKSKRNRLYSYKQPPQSIEKRKPPTKRQLLFKKRRAILSK